MSRTQETGTLSGRNLSISQTILLSFTVITAAATIITGFTLYRQFAARSRQMMTESAERLTERAVVTLEDYLTDMRQLSDAMYYDVIKDRDFKTDSIDTEMNMFYETGRDRIVSLALYSLTGSLVSAAPSAIEKPGLDVASESWFSRAINEVENFHFSLPHVQNLFDDPNYRYYWVISLSRAVRITVNGVPRSGVLLVDMNYSNIVQMLDDINAGNSTGQYMYLTDNNGNIIYHPKMMQISADILNENNEAVAAYEDGVREESFGGETRVVIVDTVSYTGWKLVSVIPSSSFSLSLNQMRSFLVMVMAIMLLAIVLINRIVAAYISSPVLKLDDAVRNASGETPIPDDSFENGSLEIQNLGKTLQNYQKRNSQLMRDIVREQEEKRKSELDALQSQINPHFLYNTLDSIVWMIESGRDKDATQMITQLANIFRISLSKGNTIIPIEDELRHAINYMNIQQVRFRNAFEVKFEADPDLSRYCTVKLIIQPILENAIYYGVKNMDEDGMIIVRDWKDGDDIYISVEDNGFGMGKEEVAQLLLEDRSKANHHGSGVGLYNVHKRIQLRFGENYGLRIESEPDVGTVVIIRFPAIPYTEENRKMLEEGGKEKGV